MPTDGCQTEGCATDEDWAENFIKGILQTTDLTDPNDNPKGQLTLHFYQWTLDHYTPEVGPITPGDVLRDAWHAAATHVRASGLSAAQDLEHMQRMGVVLNLGVVTGATALTQSRMQGSYAFIKGYLDSLSGPLSRGSTASLAKGTTLPRNLREQLAFEEAMSNPRAGKQIPIQMTDPRWPASEGWVKMQLIVDQGGGPVEILGAGGPINVHYVWNTIMGVADDFKIVIRGQ
jgi:hypothetical protein